MTTSSSTNQHTNPDHPKEMGYEYLLLIFRKWPETETYWLINRPGLPVSPASPLLANTPSDPLLVPDLLASLTETLVSDVAVYSGHQLMNTWATAANDSRAGPQSTDHFVLLGRRTSTNKPQTETQNQDQADADAHNNNTSQTLAHAIRNSINWVSRDLARIDARLSQALEISESFRP